MDGTQSSRRALQQIWRKRVETAAEHYHSAQIEARRAVSDQIQGFTPSPDGGLAARRALQEEIAALQEYTRVLTIFHKLLMEGALPEATAGRAD